ncbi:ferredoxin [Catenulispora yoronensis]|uniref:ferredoxin n=1 Tax=Catenulispora yoronensis TaxID=450799 RepID=UPI0031E2FBD3
MRATWEERNWRNIPGPFYGGETDTCEAGPPIAPRHVLADENGQEFVYRQPRTRFEVETLLFAAWNDPFGGYACDGDEHWTVEAIRSWWSERARVREWAISFAANDFVAYLDGEAADHLRDYMFWLEERRQPGAGVNRPDL